MNDSLVKNREELTKSEKKICDYIEEYMNNSIYMTVTEIANGCGVGEATVTRFCRKLGFRSFLEFKMTIAQEFKNKTANEGVLTDDIVANSENIESVAKGLYEININLLDNSLKSIDFNQLDEITDKIINSKKIHFVGVGHSGLIAENSYYKFLRCGMNSDFFRDGTNFQTISNLIKENEIVFVISNNGNDTEINQGVDIAKKNGALIVSLTNNFISKLGRLSDYVISYMGKDIQTPTGNLSIEAQQSFIIDILYNNYLRKTFDYIK